MAHQIEEYDVTFSTLGTEWHGLAVIKSPEEMLDAIRENLFFPIVESPATFEVDGVSTPLRDSDGNGWKVIAADCRDLPTCEGREKHPSDFVPLHIPKAGYNPLENEIFFESLFSAMEKIGIDFEISTAGTLGNLAYFYFCLAIKNHTMKGGRGEEIKPYLTGMTSHNGFILPKFKDNYTRTVCKNTFDAVLREISALDIQGKHTANGLECMKNMEERLEAFFTGTEKLEREIFPRLQSREMDSQEMRETVAGYFLLPALEGKANISNYKLSTQARNAVDGIVSLARHGQGNAGETAYDLWNGATDYWSNGSGVGSETVGLRKKAFRSNFGQASKHKAEFSDYIFSEEKISQGREIGQKVLLNMASEN